MNELIPRALLFGNPERTQVRLSHDGQQVSFLAPVNGVMNVWVAPVDQVNAAKPITNDTVRGIPFYLWAYDNTHVIHIQDQAGDENWHIYSVNTDTLEGKDLTPIAGVNAQFNGMSHHVPDEIVVGLNDRVPQLHDLYRINIVTGGRTLLEQNVQGFVNYKVDQQYVVRLAIEMKANGENILHRKTAQGWEVWQTIPEADNLTTQAMHFDESGLLYMTDSRDRNTGALYRVNLETDHKQLLAEHARVDVGYTIAHPSSAEVQAVGFTVEREEFSVIDPEVAPDLEYLRTVTRGELAIERTLDDRQWLVSDSPDNGPVRFLCYDRSAQSASVLFTDRPALEQQPLAAKQAVTITARDGLPLVSYLTRPINTNDQAVPLVLLVHGGPWGRNHWNFDPEAQFLANRGYAVLQVNFRGSNGFGKHHINAGNLEWGGKMHDDLLDAVDWAVREGITKRETVAIMGGSYGGYATLAGLTMTPDVFVCGVDIVGPSNLQTLLESVPAYWEPIIAMLRMRVGDNTTEEGRALLNQRSPLTHAAKISRPLLIGQGANDPRVKQAESDQIVHAMRENNIPVTYALFPDEGHGFARPENNLAFYAITEAFLAKHLGGRAEAIGTALEGSSMQILEGADGIPGFSG
jgi:dipeptidyl aminopeptidase/acylaminoacyl peptidase